MNYLGRNDPCWCGSGKKFKKCHLHRDSQPKENPWAAVAANQEAFSKKKCCARDVGLGECEKNAIKAHTVSRGPNLAKIAKKGHVIQYKSNIKEIKDNKRKLSATKIGINDASTFYGFCEKHDRELFSCIENETFNGAPKQCLAIAYRSLCHELYGKDASTHIRETLRGADKGLDILGQIFIQKMLDEMSMGIEASQRELKATYDTLTSALVEDRPEILSSIIFEFSETLPFMFAGAWSPFTDLHSSEIQIGYVDENLEQLFVSSFSAISGTMLCFSWINSDNAPGKIIANQLMALPDDLKTSACLQLVMKHVENVFFDPDWFQSLDEKHRQHLDQLASDGLDTMGSVPSLPVRFDIDFHLPKPVRTFLS